MDEADSVYLSRLSPSQLIDALRHVDPPFFLYYSLLHVWGMGRPSLLSARLFSAVAALPTIPLVYIIGTHLFTRRVGFLASTLVALNFLFLTEAREARMYALLISVETASWLLFLLLREKPTAVRFIAYLVLTTLSVYVHPIALLNVATQGVVCLALVRTRLAVYSIVGAQAAAAVCSIPLILFVRQGGDSEVSWIPRPTIPWIWHTLVTASGTGAAAAIGIAFVTSAIVLAFPSRIRSLSIAATWLVSPGVLALLISSITQPIFVNRYLIETVPAAGLLTAWAVFALPSRTAQRLAILVLAVASLTPLVRVYTVPRMDWNGVNAVLNKEAHVSDQVFVYPTSLLPAYEIATEGETAAHLDRVFPPKDALPWELYRDDHPASLESRSDVVWLVGQEAAWSGAVPSFTKHFQMSESFALNGLILRRYSRVLPPLRKDR